MGITGCLIKMTETMVDMKEFRIVERNKAGVTSLIPQDDLEKPGL